MTVVDASVVVKWFVSEIGWEDARRLAQYGGRLWAPSHVLVEIGRGLLRHYRNAALSRDQVRLSLDGLRSEVSLLPPEALIETAFDITIRSSVTIYDALYVAAAVELDCELVTADRRLLAGLIGTDWAGRAILLRDWSSSRETPTP